MIRYFVPVTIVGITVRHGSGSLSFVRIGDKGLLGMFDMLTNSIGSSEPGKTGVGASALPLFKSFAHWKSLKTLSV